MKQKTDELQTTQSIEQTYALFEEFRRAYGPEWARLEKCERIYHGDHWYGVPETDPGEPRPTTPVIQSTIENVRADLMDQYPQAVILADDPAYAKTAEALTAAVAENHIRSNYLEEYDHLTHDLLVGGYMVQEVGFDAALNAGLGGCFIRQVEPRSILFDPLCSDLADGRAIFKFLPYPRAWFEQRYPDKAPLMHADGYRVRPARDGLLTADDGDCILLLECWQREYDPSSGLFRIHMKKLAGGVLLEDSRALKPEGYFAHGEYPFLVTPLFPRKGSCLGYGFVDMFENQQLYSDKLDQIVLKNALMASRNKLLVTGASGFDPDDLRDWSKEVHRGENLNGVIWFPTAPLPGYVLEYIRAMRNAIKEESGANDFSRGMTAGGVTAASAIAALQEMSSKRSRMAARVIHAAFEAAVRQEIEVEREFCVFPRSVAAASPDQARAQFCAKQMFRPGASGERIPLEFSITVKAQRENRFTVAAHNELILGMTRMNMLTPDVALELMLFDGKAQAQSLMAKKLEEAKAAKAAQEAAKAESSRPAAKTPIADELNASARA